MFQPQCWALAGAATALSALTRAGHGRPGIGRGWLAGRQCPAYRQQHRAQCHVRARHQGAGGRHQRN
jgi:hypothetical protein